jgi:phage/plasmid-like protein (TIGR03299 family)
MAHQVETMAYAGQVPWHGLGVQVDNTMSPEQMLEAAKLDWTVSKRPDYTVDKPDVWNIIDPTGEASFIRCEGDYHLVRDSDNKVMGKCGDSYVPFQNSEVMHFFKKFTDAGKMTMETAGSLKEGKDIWGLAKLTDEFSLTGGDHIKGYLLLNNSHQVGKAMTIMFTPIRVVCNNTLTMALNDAHNRFRVLHLQMFDEEIHKAAELALGLSGNQMKLFKEQAEFLASKTAKSFDLDNWIAELFQPNLLIERAKADDLDTLPPLHQEFSNTADLVYQAVETSPGHDMSSAKGTWWGALNAVTHVVDHQKRSQIEGNALHSAWFGSGAQTKRKALTKALEYAGS